MVVLPTASPVVLPAVTIVPTSVTLGEELGDELEDAPVPGKAEVLLFPAVTIRELALEDGPVGTFVDDELPVPKGAVKELLFGTVTIWLEELELELDEMPVLRGADVELLLGTVTVWLEELELGGLPPVVRMMVADELEELELEL